MKNDGDPNEAELWHGTRATPPEKLYRDEDCAFDFRFSDKGYWGKGSYFAKDSRYSVMYSHKLPGVAPKEEQILLALVTKGCVDDRGTDRDPELKRPGHGCHSVEAFTQGHHISVLYETSARAYPSYLVTFSRGGRDTQPSSGLARSPTSPSSSASVAAVASAYNAPLSVPPTFSRFAPP